MKNMNDLVSIIVPVYNIEKYVKRCIESILNQTYKLIEIILVDDGSTDNSGKICDKFALQDDRIRVLHQTNQGQSVARNNGIELAKGEFLCFVDGDDYVEDSFIQYFVELQNKSKAEIVYCSVNHIGFPGRKSNNGSDKWQIFSGEKAAWSVLASKNGFTGSVCRGMFKKELFRDIYFVPGRVYEDLEILLKLNMKAKKCVISEMKNYNYCWRSDNSSSLPINKKVDDFYEVMKSIYLVTENNYELKEAACARDIMNCIFILLGATKKEFRNKEICGSLRQRILSINECYDLQTPLYKIYYQSLKIGVGFFCFSHSIISVIRHVLIRIGL